MPKQEGLLKLSSIPSPDQVLGDREGSGKWKETCVSSEKCSGFVSNRPAVLEMSCGQDSADLAPSVELLPARGPIQQQAVQIFILVFCREAGSVLVLPMKEQGCSVEAALLKPSLTAPFFRHSHQYHQCGAAGFAACPDSIPAFCCAFQPRRGHLHPRNSILRSW